jgi:hypothetical protein
VSHPIPGENVVNIFFEIFGAGTALLFAVPLEFADLHPLTAQAAPANAID